MICIQLGGGLRACALSYLLFLGSAQLALNVTVSSLSSSFSSTLKVSLLYYANEALGRIEQGKSIKVAPCCSARPFLREPDGDSRIINRERLNPRNVRFYIVLTTCKFVVDVPFKYRILRQLCGSNGGYFFDDNFSDRGEQSNKRIEGRNTRSGRCALARALRGNTCSRTYSIIFISF